ncbi:exodeoxyribonuclease VII large subunit [uncultured Friedmanniella sp.]|uniref:exodeoxyribonuclease VII large subunit n=1 Tax=uncultured Friedmanniella sp. TaxID=335381 RepID=UPI0035C9F078
MPLESSPENPQPLRLVVHLVRGWIERLGAVWVEGQLIEINRRSGSKLIFLTLRDRLSEVSVSVTVSPTTLDAAGPLTEGSTVVAHLKPSYYEGSGRFSFACDAITPVGEGQLLARLEQTKRLLQAEGLFDRARKRPLPFLPRVVGLVTAAGSAAERDVVENARRRWPAVRIETRHALVQGSQAGEQLITAVRALDALEEVDVIVVARGGGSLEDLLTFSDEGLVRAVSACRTPVVSAIGHETDNPILDLVADYRASTPTDAAKRVVPDVTEELARLGQARTRLDRAVRTQLDRRQQQLDGLRSRPVLTDPTASFAVRYEQLAGLRHRSERAVAARLEQERVGLDHQLARVRAMSPKATLERGYSILVGPDGHAVTSVTEIDEGDDLLAYLVDGQLVLEAREQRPASWPTAGAAR